MRGTVPPLPQYASIAWCSVQAQGQLYLTSVISSEIHLQISRSFLSSLNSTVVDTTSLRPSMWLIPLTLFSLSALSVRSMNKDPDNLNCCQVHLVLETLLNENLRKDKIWRNILNSPGDIHRFWSRNTLVGLFITIVSLTSPPQKCFMFVSSSSLSPFCVQVTLVCLVMLLLC
jgi:hypothetical protein